MNPITALTAPGVNQLVPYIPGKPIEELERELGLQNIIKLASNENPLGPSTKVLEAIQAALPSLSLYPDGNGFNLKKALAAKYGLQFNQITLGNGSNDLLELVARAFLSPAVEALFSQYAFAVYPIVTQAIGAKAVIVPAREYGNDLELMASYITSKTRIVFIANPNNPTGTWVTSDKLKAFIRALPENCLCVLDEAYCEYHPESSFDSSVSWLANFPNLIITRTFSKAYGLAGLRVGYSLCRPEIADILNRVRQPFNNNTLALVAAEAALTDVEYLHKTITTNNQGMSLLTQGFANLGLEWIPSAGNFISVNLGRPAQPIYQDLLHRGIIVRPVANYGLPNHLRITIGTQAENIYFLEALAASLANVP